MSNPQKPVRNVLYIMCDQLRRDYLSCYGHPHLHTPNIDRLAAAGVRFSRAYTQGTICGPSRMSAYTGRYVSSHQVAWNAVPLPLEELTLGDYLRPHGIRTALVGKTHATANVDALQRLAINPASEQAEVFNEVGFEPYFRHDGIFPDDPLFDDKRESAPYTHYLREQGFNGRNPWHDWRTPPKAKTAKSSAAGKCVTPICRRGFPSSIQRPSTLQIEPSTSSVNKVINRGVCTSRTSNRIGPTSYRRHTTPHTV
jgi:arylsulfatase A-like enzyme